MVFASLLTHGPPSYSQHLNGESSPNHVIKQGKNHD